MAKSRSSVLKLDPAIKAELDRLLRDGRFTLDQVVAHLATLGADELPSRSAIGRYAKNLEQISARMNRAKEIADRLVEQAGPGLDEGKGLAVLAQGFESLAFDYLASVDEDAPLDPENLMFFAKAVGEVTRARSAETNRLLKVREATAKSAAAAAEKVCRQEGLSADVVRKVGAAVLGVV